MDTDEPCAALSGLLVARQWEGIARDIVFPGGMTSIAAPSGVGKSVVVLILAYELARGGVFRGQTLQAARIFFLDTDNPRSLLHHRLQHICAQHQGALDVMSRDKTPKAHRSPCLVGAAGRAV